MIEDRTNIMLNVIKASIWGTEIRDPISLEIYDEMKTQAIAALPAKLLSSDNIPDKLRHEWKKFILQQVSFNTQYSFFQRSLPIDVPYAILKGTSVAQYYPSPLLRTMGDIDIITKHEDYNLACSSLLQNGYREISNHDEKYIRHRTFYKNGIVVEVHLYFAMFDDIDMAKYLDDLIINSINTTHVLPDLINGLVVLEHINQHIESGLGLRHVIDWMMFVHNCLSDAKWSTFERMTEKVGLTKLAIVLTRMCELYLGLTCRKWCEKAEVSLCNDLLEYILSNGNFGIKRKSDTDISINFFAYAKNPYVAFKLIQKQGRENWKAARKYKVLRPFAWIYQAFRYAIRGLRRSNAAYKIKEEYRAARKRNAMFIAIGIKSTAKGTVIYKDGKYKKR